VTKRALSALWTRGKLRRAPRLRERRGGKREPVDRNRLRVAAATSRPRRSGDLTRPQERRHAVRSGLDLSGHEGQGDGPPWTAQPGWRHLGHAVATLRAARPPSGDRALRRTVCSRRASCSRVFGPGGRARAPRTRASVGSFAGATDTAWRRHDDPHGWTRRRQDGDRDRTCLHGLGRDRVGSLQPGEPHGRQRGATDPQRIVWRKPPKS
jgi:hypothetical protein